MTLPFAIALLGGVLEDTDLLALAVLDDLGVHLRTLHHGSAELSVLAVDDGQDLVEHHGITRVDVQLLDKQGVALRDVVLLTTGHDNCLHACCTCLSFITDSLSGASGRSRNLIPIQSGLSSISAAAAFVNHFPGGKRRFLLIFRGRRAFPRSSRRSRPRSTRSSAARARRRGCGSCRTRARTRRAWPRQTSPRR